MQYVNFIKIYRLLNFMTLALINSCPPQFSLPQPSSHVLQIFFIAFVSFDYKVIYLYRTLN